MIACNRVTTHADPRKSLHLYGRDSVWGSLRYQKTVLYVAPSWDETPLTEPVVHIELFRKQADDYTYQFLPFSPQSCVVEVDEDPLTEEQQQSSSSSSDGSSQSEVEDISKVAIDAIDKLPIDGDSCDEIILAKHRRVTHAIMILSSSDSLQAPKYMGKACKPACGTHMVHSETTFLDEWNTNLSFCQHPGCKKAWSALGMF